MIRNLLSLLCLGLVVGCYANLTRTEETGEKEEKRHDKKEKRAFRSLKASTTSLFREKSEDPFMSGMLVPVPSSEDLEIRKSIEATFEKVQKENRFIKYLDENALIDLPVGLKSDIGALSYVILIDSFIISPKETLLYTSMSFEAPGMGKIHFRGADIPFSKNGGILSSGKMELVGDYAFSDAGGNSQFVIKGSEQKTYVEFDCNGFKQMSLHAGLAFSRNLIKPVDQKGTVIPGENVMLDFTTTLSDWNDLLVEASLPPFEVNGLKGYIFDIGQAVLDYSDLQNSAGIIFPDSYSQFSPYLQSGDPNLWRGVFIKDLTVTLPKQFISKTEDGNKYNQVSFSGTNMLLDNMGFSGLIKGSNIIPIEKGKIGNWDFSLDEIKIDFVANTMQEAGFKGLVDIPINSKRAKGEAKNDYLFGYEALIKPNNEYMFTVSNAKQLEFDMWKAAEVTLYKSSYVEISSIDDEFIPKAVLNGKMAILAGMGSGDGSPEADDDKNVFIPEVIFEKLTIQSVKPYVSIGSFSLGGTSSAMSGFPIRIDRIGGGQKGNNLFLDVELTVTLTGREGGSFGATGGVKFISESRESGDDVSYHFKKVELTKFGVDIDQGTFKFKGILNFFREDNSYGNGISGTVDAVFGGFMEVQGNAIFGKKDGMSFWMVDALYSLPKAYPILPPYLFMHEFGGGASYHMKLNNEGVKSELGKTASGIVYVPDRNTGFSVKAIVGLSSINEKIFNGDLTFEMAFNKGGGLKYINFRGNGYALSGLKRKDDAVLGEQAAKMAGESKAAERINEVLAIAENILGPPDSKGAPIYGRAMIHFDFENKSLSSTMNMDIDLFGVIEGGGVAAMFFSRDEWYIYIGRPEYENRIYLEVFGIARFDSYFVAGSQIPDSPPPPPELEEIWGRDLNYMKELNELPDGGGVGFGSSFQFDTGNISFLVFYGRFKAGIGFDVMLKDYGETRCKGKGQIGIDGWYANGQAYGYFDGMIGIRIKLLFVTKRIEILRIGAAAVIQAKLPNPVWMRATVGGRYSVLGGLIKGTCRFRVTIGSECEIEESSSSVLEGVEVISQISPRNGTHEVDVFTLPQAVFNYEMNKSYYAEGKEKTVTFRLALERFEITGPNGKIEAERNWNEGNTVAVLRSEDILPGETDLQLDVSVVFEELIDGSWQVVKDLEGQEMRKTETLTFRTASPPDYIPESNVAFSYPSADMLNFYKNENGSGYVRLLRGQGYLFEEPDFDPIARFIGNGKTMDVPMRYSQTQKEITFSFPDQLEKDKVYQLNLVSVPRLKTNIESNISLKENVVNNQGSEVIITTRSATGSIRGYEEIEHYQSHFRTSKYNTFAEKVANVNPSSGWRKPVYSRVHRIGSNFDGPEPFSLEEIYGRTPGEEPLIQMVADLKDNRWFKEDIEPLVYIDYPFTFRRNPTILGKVPTRAVYLYQYPDDYQLEENHILSGHLSFTPLLVGRFDYELAYIMFQDFSDLQWRAARSTYNTSKVNRLLTASFPTIRGGDYSVDIQYRLPGKKTVSSSVRHKIRNPID